MTWLRRHGEVVLFAVSLLLLAVGGVGWAAGRQALESAWVVATWIGLLAATWWLAQSLRAGRVGVDVIALLALAGTLVVDEPLAGAVITLMLATGRVLEAHAAARASRELGLLVRRTPRTARRAGTSGLEEVPVEAVVRGDRLVVGSGEVLPVDGRLLAGAVLDESTLTGEPLPVDHPAGDQVRSGSVNAGSPVELVATATAADSTYATIVRLVEQARADSAPFVRTADRVAAAFVPATLALAVLAWWTSGDAVRAVAVLVVATPCPLILAAPIAIMSGLSRAARSGVVVKGGGALEHLAKGRVILFDKTGTLTRGRPAVVAVVTSGSGADADTMLRLAGSLDQVSPHVMAGAVVTAARDRNLELELPHQVGEQHGHGIEGVVDGHLVRLGTATWVSTEPHPSWMRRVRRRADLDGSSIVYVGVDGDPVGAMLLQDPVRADAPRMIRALRHSGITRTVLVTGDRADVAETVGRVVGMDTVVAELDPAQKLDVVHEEREHGPTIMVGDGVNDAPALAAADVGVALAAGGATASSETADIVLTVDRVDALADAILIAHRSRRMGLQAVVLGMGLSAAAMLAAAAGVLPPTTGAVLQEGIDVLAILTALRAVLPGGRHTVSLAPEDAAIAGRLHEEHVAVRPVVEQVRAVADELDTARDAAPVRALLADIDAALLPHEHAEEAELLPVMARVLGGPDSVAGLSRTHAEIDHQVSRLRRLVHELDTAPLEVEDRIELRRLLYGLYAVLRLHDAQEEESVYSLVPEAGRAQPARVPAATPVTGE